jgi:hypothetical protein
MPVISKWKLERCTTSRHLCINQKVPTSSHIHSSTGHKTSVAASPVKKKLGRNHLLTIDCTMYNLCKKKQKANHSLTLDIITKADFFQKLIYPPFNVTVVALNTYLCPVDKSYYINTQIIV